MFDFQIAELPQETRQAILRANELPQETQQAILRADAIVAQCEQFSEGDLIRMITFHMIRGLPIREASKISMATFAAVCDSGEKWLLSECCSNLYA